MSDEPLRPDVDFDRDFWRACARRGLQEAFRALEDGRMAFGSWERLYLSAAIDHFRYRNFKLGALPRRKASLIFAPNTKDSHEGSYDRPGPCLFC